MKKINLKTENKLDTSFSMSSMTDILFLLLIFFMVTTSFDNLEGLNIDLPKSSSSIEVNKDINIIIDSQNQSQNNNVYNDLNKSI